MFASARNTLGYEIIGWVIGIVIALVLSAVFPPALILVLGLALMWYFTNERQKKLRQGPPQPPQQDPPR